MTISQLLRLKQLFNRLMHSICLFVICYTISIDYHAAIMGLERDFIIN